MGGWVLEVYKISIIDYLQNEYENGGWGEGWREKKDNGRIPFYKVREVGIIGNCANS